MAIRTGFAWLACAVSIASLHAQTATETVLYSFRSAAQGAVPLAGLLRDAAGNLYGTASSGGAFNKGAIYRLDPAGRLNVLYSFKGVPDGAAPQAGVIGDAAGNLYGTTYFGGTANDGTIYKLDNTGHESVLYSFHGGADGQNPGTSLLRDPKGNLYGTTPSFFWANSSGTIYQLNTSNHLTTLYRFGSVTGDGTDPLSAVIGDGAGNLYGTTNAGGASGFGTVYKLDATLHESVLYSFKNGADGGSPVAGVIRDSSGNLYGTTQHGGFSGIGGVVYELDAAGNEATLYTFTGFSDGGEPTAGVVRDSAGNLYGTTNIGGLSDFGTVYKLDAAGNLATLYNFTNGTFPYYASGVIQDSAGNLYGTTSTGGSPNLGFGYQVDAAGNETALYTFQPPLSGSFPEARLARDKAGNLYGTTIAGGTANQGVIYKLDTTDHEFPLHSFTGGNDGAQPFAGLIGDGAGNLYGTTLAGGAFNSGTVYKLDATGGESVVYGFAGIAVGSNPYAGVIRDSAGNFYGTTYGGGSEFVGVVYKVSAAGQGSVLYTFTGAPDGGNPYAGVIMDPAGNLYGTTQNGGMSNLGTVYKVDTAGDETVLYSFTGGADGGNPFAGVVRDSAGNLYGTTQNGGTGGGGVVYKLDPAGNETVLHPFAGGTDGSDPWAGVIRDSADNLYGTTVNGGPYGAGVVYKLDPAGNETILYTFTGGADGGNPESGVIGDGAGNLYGTANTGGAHGTGVVYKLSLK